MASESGSTAEQSTGSGGTGRARPIRGLAGGFVLLFEGLRLVRRRRDLWRLSAVPLACSLALVALALGLLYGYAADVHGLLTGWMPALAADAWYEWIWVGPGRVLFTVLGWALFLVAIGVSVVAASLVANVVAAPFLDALSQRVEKIESGALVESSAEGLGGLVGEVGRSIVSELRRVSFFAVAWGTVFALGVVIPGGQLVAPWVLVGLTIIFLPLDYAGYALDRRELPFRARRAWLRANLATVSGFGGAAFLVCMVPGLNLLLLPALVSAGTLLALRHPPVSDARTTA